jgi:hypothetical protein
MEKKQKFLSIALIYFFIVLLSGACKNDNEAQLKVKISGLEGKSAIIQEQRVNNIKILDTVAFDSKGKLLYKVSLRQPSFYNLVIPASTDLFFLVYPGDKIEVTAKSNNEIINLTIEGSPESEKLNILYDSLFATRKILKAIRKEYKSTEEQSIRNSLNEKYEQVISSYKKFSYQFVLQNLNSLCSIAALYQEVGPSEFVFGQKRDMQFFKLVTDSLGKYYPRHRHVQALKRNFDVMYESLTLENILGKVGTVENSLPNLLLPSPNGKEISLSDIKQRYVLLNFYNEDLPENSVIFPQLNTIYTKYSNKNFNIYNVYLGKSTDNWKKLIHYEEIDKWVNVADTSFPLSKTRTFYNVQSLPSNFLIDLKENAILLRDVSPEKLARILSNLNSKN